MKILFIYYLPSGGVETLARQRSAALKPRGIDFHFLYYEKGSGLQNISEKTFVTKNDVVIEKIITKERYDAIIVNTDHVIIPKLRQMGYKGKIIYEIQGLGSFDQAKSFLASVQPLVEKHIDAVLCPKTPHLEQYIDTFFQHTPKFCFHNGIDTNRFSYVSGLPKEKHVLIGWVGRIEDNKNWRLFLAICEQLVKWNHNVRIWMFGDDTLSFLNEDEMSQFEQELEKKELKSVIKRFSNVPNAEMAMYYSRIGNSGGFLCSTSKVEGFGYALVEAMSCRCPVIATDSDGVKSFIIHNRTGKLFPQDDVEKGVLEAKELLSQPKLRQLLRLNGRKYIEQHFSLPKYADHFILMLKKLGLSI